MRRVIAALVIALLAIVVAAPAAQAGAWAPRADQSGAAWSWFEQALETVWSFIAGAGTAPPAASAATDAPSDPDRGPGMDPDG